MGYGALDAIDTPTLGPRGEISGAALLLHKIEIIGKLLQKPAERSTGAREAVPIAHPRLRHSQASRIEKMLDPLVVVGASTGGPQALAEVLVAASRRFRPASSLFSMSTRRLPRVGAVALRTNRLRRAARWLTDISLLWATSCFRELTTIWCWVKIAASIIPSSPGRARTGRLSTFFSTVRLGTGRGPGVAVLLTGMLRDGAIGLLNLRRSGWRTIAQDESSSVVWGMPKAAVEIGAAEEVVSLPQIAGAIERLMPS